MHAQLLSGLSTVGAEIPPAPPWLRAKGCGLLPLVPEFHGPRRTTALSGEHCSIIEYPFCWCAPYINHIWMHSQLNSTFLRGFWWLNQSGATRFSMDSVLLPHLIEGRFVTAVELGAGCGIMALQLFAHGKTTLLHLAESNPLLLEALRRPTAINALDGFFMLYQTDAENLRVSGDLVYFNPPYGRGKVGKGERLAAISNDSSEKNRLQREVAYI